MNLLLKSLFDDDMFCIRKQICTNIIYLCSYSYKNSNMTQNGNY